MTPEWVDRSAEADAEYNEHVCRTSDGQFILSSDRDGNLWTVEDPSGETFDLNAESLDSAKEEAMKDYVLEY